MTRPIRRRRPTTRRSSARCRRLMPKSLSLLLSLSSVGIVQAASEIGLKPKIFGRRNGRSAGDRDQEQARTKSTASSIRDLGAVGEDDEAGGRVLHRSTRRSAGQIRHRPARLLPRRMGLCLHKLAGRRDRGARARRQQDRRLHPQDPLQDHHGRMELRQERRMDQVCHHAGAVHGIKEGAGSMSGEA